MRLFFGVLIGLFLAVLIAGVAAHHVFGGFKDVGERDKSKDITQTFEVADFDRIDVGGVFELKVKVGGDYAVTISGAPDEMARLQVNVANGVLELDQKGDRNVKRHWRNAGLTATISLPALNGVEVAGVADGEFSGIDAESFRADLSGVGEINLSGTCGHLDANMSGVGDLDAKDLECKDVDVDVSGVGEAVVYASESVDASVNGIGSIEVYGSPANVEKQSSFISSITVH